MAKVTLRELAYEMIRLSAIRGRMFMGSGEEGRLNPIESPVECHHSTHEPPIERFGIDDIDLIIPAMSPGFMAYSIGDHHLTFLPLHESEFGQVLKYSVDECRIRWLDIDEHPEYPILRSNNGLLGWVTLAE